MIENHKVNRGSDEPLIEMVKHAEAAARIGAYRDASHDVDLVIPEIVVLIKDPEQAAAQAVLEKLSSKIINKR